MATAKHTSGPWVWERVATHGMIPEYTLQGPDVLCRYWCDGPQTSDAHLIAAAPQLLEALDDLCGPGAQYEHECDRMEHDYDSLCIWCCARNVIKAATES